MYANIDQEQYQAKGEKITVVGYCRLSRDEDKENYSSIEEQKRIIKEYVSSRNWTIEDKDFYIDDNVSGYTFNRPEFTKMIEKVKEGKIDVSHISPVVFLRKISDVLRGPDPLSVACRICEPLRL